MIEGPFSFVTANVESLSKKRIFDTSTFDESVHKKNKIAEIQNNRKKNSTFYISNKLNLSFIADCPYQVEAIGCFQDSVNRALPSEVSDISQINHPQFIIYLCTIKWFKNHSKKVS